MYDTEADIVLSYDAGIQAIEIEQEYEILIESFFWVKDMPSLIFLPIHLFLFLTRILILPELIRDYQLPLVAFVHNQVLISLSPLILQASPPYNPADVTQLSRHLQDLEVVHQSKCNLSLLLYFTNYMHRLEVVEILEGLLLAHAFEYSLRLNVVCHRLELVVD